MDQRTIALGTVAIGVILLVAGVFSSKWLVNADVGADLHVGLRSVEVCIDGECKSEPFAELGRRLKDVKTLGLVTMIVGLVTAASLLLCGVLGLLRKATDWFIAPTTIAILMSAIALVLGVVTLTTFQKALGSGVGTGLGFAFFGIGAAAGLTGAILVGRFPRNDEEHFDPPFEPT